MKDKYISNSIGLSDLSYRLRCEILWKNDWRVHKNRIHTFNFFNRTAPTAFARFVKHIPKCMMRRQCI